MANNCWNNIEVENINPEQIKTLDAFFNDKAYEAAKTIGEWVNNDPILGGHRLKNFDYGGRWFDFHIDSDGIAWYEISGDSAWSPMEGLAELISEIYNAKVTLKFSEGGMDFAGKDVWTNGVPDEDERVNTNCFTWEFLEEGTFAVLENYGQYAYDEGEFDGTSISSTIKYLQDNIDDRLPKHHREKIDICAESVAEWVHNNIKYKNESHS